MDDDDEFEREAALDAEDAADAAKTKPQKGEPKRIRSGRPWLLSG